MFLRLISVPANSINNTTANNELQYFKEFESMPQHNIPVDAYDPILGDNNSPVKIIVFSDFQCPSCRYFSQVLKDLESNNKGRFHVVFKHFPLDTACNSAIANDVHPRACEAAMAAEAAKQQGKFWEFHDAAFSTDLNKVDETVCSNATRLNLDHKRFEENRISQI